MERKDVKEVLYRVDSSNDTAKDEEIAKYWLHYFRRKDIPDLLESELSEESDTIYQSLVAAQKPKPEKIRHLGIRISVAAAAIIIILGACIFYFNTSRFNITAYKDSNAFYKNDIAPGTNKAMITLANGKTIDLSDTKTRVVIDGGSLKYSDGSFVRYTSGPQSSVPLKELLTATTPRGGQYQVVLADGTRVWLNAASSLRFPSVFSRSANRVVELSGEAYFEVAKDKAHPFIVVTEQQEVKVLGTHFNINSYIDEGAVKTTLLEGAVSVTPIQTARSEGQIRNAGQIILKPNQQSILANHKIKVVEADTEQELAWKNGYFRFNNEKIQNIMNQLSRWYNIEILYEGAVPTEGFYGTISRFKNINEVLKMLEDTKGIRFKVEGRRVTVME